MITTASTQFRRERESSSRAELPQTDGSAGTRVNGCRLAVIDLGLEIRQRPCTFIEEWEKQEPGPAFLRVHKAKPLGTFKIQLEVLQGF